MTEGEIQRGRVEIEGDTSHFSAINYYAHIFTQPPDNYNNNTQIAAIALLPSTTHPQLWAELLTFKPKCTIA